MTAIIRPFAWAGASLHTGTRDDQDHDAILLAQDPPGCIVRRAAVQSISNSTFTDISFDTETADNDTMFAATSTTVTIQHDGWYLIAVGSVWANNTTSHRATAVTLNGTTINEIAAEGPVPSASSNFRHSAAGGLVLVTTDVIRVNVWQGSGGALNCNTRLTVVRVSGPGS